MERRRPAYELTLENRHNYLYAHVEGDVSRPGVAVEYLKRITDACRKAQCSRVIIDKDVPREFGVWDIFFVATRFPKLGVEATKIAVVDKGMLSSNRTEFSVVVGKRPGLDVHIFKTVPEAEEWVLTS